MTDPSKAPQPKHEEGIEPSRPNALVSIAYVAVGGLVFLSQLASLLSGGYKARALNDNEATGALIAVVVIAAVSGWLCYHGIRRLRRRDL